MPEYFNQHAIRMRDRLGAALMPTLRSSCRALSSVMLGLSPQQWDMPCAFFQHFGGQQPARAFLLLIIQELVIHGWDVRSRFDTTATLAPASLPPLLERIPHRIGFARFPIDADRWPLMRYQFDLRGERPQRYDLIVEGGKTRLEPARNVPAEVTLHCDPATFTLMMYKRLTLAPAVSSGRLTVAGDEALVAALDQWLHQP
jgi:hypothetical protein